MRGHDDATGFEQVGLPVPAETGHAAASAPVPVSVSAARTPPVAAAAARVADTHPAPRSRDAPLGQAVLPKAEPVATSARSDSPGRGTACGGVLLERNQTGAMRCARHSAAVVHHSVNFTRLLFGSACSQCSVGVCVPNPTQPLSYSLRPNAILSNGLHRAGEAEPLSGSGNAPAALSGTFLTEELDDEEDQRRLAEIDRRLEEIKAQRALNKATLEGSEAGTSGASTQSRAGVEYNREAVMLCGPESAVLSLHALSLICLCSLCASVYVYLCPWVCECLCASSFFLFLSLLSACMCRSL